MIPAKIRGIIMVLLIGVFMVWFTISSITIYLSGLRAKNSEQLAQETIIATVYLAEMNQELVKIIHQWRGLAYLLNPEVAREMDEMIERYYAKEQEKEENKEENKEKEQKESEAHKEGFL